MNQAMRLPRLTLDRRSPMTFINSVRNMLRRVLPPVVVDAARQVLKRLPWAPPAEWEFLPEGWKTRDPRIRGWNLESVVEAQTNKWPEFLRLARGKGLLGIAHEAPVLTTCDPIAHNYIMAYGYVLALAGCGKKVLSLLDWGGGLGHYCVLGQVLLPALEIDYHCKDAPLLCKAGRKLLPAAHFYDNEEDCFRRNYELVLASGSLQYAEDWPGALERLARATSSYVYVTRLPVVHQAKSFVVIQRPYRYGYATEYIGWFLNRQEFLDCAMASGLDLVREFLIGERPQVMGAPEQGEYRGFLFRSQRNLPTNEEESTI